MTAGKFRTLLTSIFVIVVGSSAYADPIWEPQRGASDRKAILDVVRDVIEGEIGVPVELVVARLRTDGHWAFVQATPQNLGGAPIDWSKTKFAQDWKADMMSDVVMGLVKKSGSGWMLEDYVLGPTDVYWVSWVSKRKLPEKLFHDGKPFVD